MASMTELITPKRQAETDAGVERIGAFAVAARPEHLATDIRQLFKRNILDSIGCAIAAVAGPSLRALRDQIEEYRAPGRCTLIGGGKTSPDQAALFNSALVRYVDLLDSYMAQGGLCHPSDNFGTLLATAEYVGASGEEFMLALAAAYEIQCRFTACVPVMAKGFNHAIQLAISAAAGAGRLFGLSVNELANAIAIATVDNISLTCVHAEPVSQWKGFSPGLTGMRADYAASLAKRGFTGPKGLFGGPYGLEQMFDQSIPVDWEDASLEIVKQTVMKKYCSLIHGQPVLQAVLDLKRRNSLAANEIENVHCNVFRPAFEFAGGGSFGPKDHPEIKEQGDYNLKYLVAAALLDGQVGPEQLETERVRRDDVQDLLARVDVKAASDLTEAYPERTEARVRIALKDGRELHRAQSDFEGSPTRPMSWGRVVEKFHWLGEPFADAALRTEIIDAVQRLEEISVAELAGLLGAVSPEAQRARTRGRL